MADYNINAVARKVSFTGSAGVGPYAFSFEILDDDDVAVYFNETLLTKTTDYTVTINLNGTGSVTIVTGTNVPTTPDADDLIVIVGARDIERTTDFVTAGDLRASALNEQLDALTIMVQQVAEEVERSVKAPVYDPTGINMILPKKSERVNAFVAFDANGDISAAVPSDDVTTLAEVATDIKNLADIEDGTIATDAISGAAAIASNITTVAGIAANVTTVAGNTSNINAVAADATDIGTVATNIASVNTVATNIADVITVANDLNEAISEIETAADDLNEAVSEIDTVATNIANVNTVGTNIANVNTVAGINADVTAVAADATDIGTVSTNIANVNTVAGISGNVTTVAGISADVTAVAGDATDIGTVATNIANVNTTATNIANVNTVAGKATEIGRLGTVDAVSDMNTLGTAATVTDMAALADVASDIATLADIQDGTTATGAITTAAANVADITNFADVYIGPSATAPTTRADSSALQVGDLYFDTATGTMKVYTSSGWAAAGSSVNGTSERQNYVVGTPSGSYDGSTTVFPATYDAGFVDVYLNGVKLVVGTDFTATNGTSITLASAATSGDAVNIIGYGTFNLADFSINDANDVSTGGVTDGQVLAYNSGTGDWEPSTIAADAITEGNSSVEVVDTGTGYVAVTADGSETARFSLETPCKITKGNTSGNALEIVNSGSSRSVDINHNADNTGIVDDIVRIKNNGTVVYELEADGNLKFNSGYGSAATAYGCRAWVSFNGTGTPAIRGSGNVSSITDIGTGRFEVNFSNAMTDANYSVVNGGSPGGGSGFADTVRQQSAFPINATKCGSQINRTDINSFDVDPTYAVLAVFR